MFQQLAGMASLLKQAQQLGPKLQQMQADLAALRVEGTDPEGHVVAIVDGQLRLTSCRIAPALLTQPADVVEEAVRSAVNMALAAAQQAIAKRTSELTGGLDLGAMGGLLTGSK